MVKSSEKTVRNNFISFYYIDTNNRTVIAKLRLFTIMFVISFVYVGHTYNELGTLLQHRKVLLHITGGLHIKPSKMCLSGIIKRIHVFPNKQL